MKKLLNEANNKLNKIDYIFLTIIIVIYSILSFINLGDLKAPQTHYNIIKNEMVTVELKNPDEARLITKTAEYKINRRLDFDKNKFAIMEKGLRAKFVQNQRAADLLKATGDALLIKSCPVCYKCGFGEGSGENRMGKILMKIRGEL